MKPREWILVRSPKGGDDPQSVLGTNSMGFTSYNTAALPDRVYAGLEASRPWHVLWGQPELDLSRVPTPLETLVEEGDGKSKGEECRERRDHGTTSFGERLATVAAWTSTR